MKNNFQKTMYACFAGYIVQAIVNNFVPLLFLTFEKFLKSLMLTSFIKPLELSK